MKLTRRSALAGIGGAVAAVPLRARAAAEFTYKLGTDQPIDHPQNARALEAAKAMEADSKGRFILKVFPYNQLGGDTEMLSQVRSGALEMMEIGDNILANLVPVASIGDIPFAFASYQQLWSALDGDLGRHIHGEVAKVGFHVFEKGWDAGFRNVFTSTRPINSVEDMKGLKLRVPQAPIQIALFKAFGAAPTALNNSELYTGLQTHLVDGAEQPMSSIESARLYEVSKWISITQHQPTTFTMVMNGRAWQRLPPDLQEIVSHHINDAAVRARQDIVDGEEALTKLLAEKQGQTILKPDREAFRDVVRKSGLYAKWRDEFGAQPFALLEQYAGKLV